MISRLENNSKVWTGKLADFVNTCKSEALEFSDIVGAVHLD